MFFTAWYIQYSITQSRGMNAVEDRSLDHPPAPFTGAPSSKLPGLHPSYPKKLIHPLRLVIL